jgi:hemoglobin-like flavoprotein
LIQTFYDHLFEVAPSVQPLFAQVDMERQRQALLNMLVVLPESLRDLDDIVPDLEDPGARHVDYGAHAEHYPVVGQVLIESMAEIAGDAWKPEYTSAWQEAYGVVQNVMLSGAAARVE